MKPVPLTLLAALALLASPPAQAQLGDLFKSFTAPSAGVVKQMEQAASAPQAAQEADKPGAAMAELPPDRQCNRPQERFNVSEKLVEYGGAEAALRLKRLVDSDFKYDDLTDDDKKMLRYLAKTTIWLPASVETSLGKIFDLSDSKTSSEASGADQMVLDEIKNQADKFRKMKDDFPGDINLRLNTELADGAYAKFGGRIQLSTNMLQLMSQHSSGAEFVLAHEVAHVYKRHAIKQLQFMLLSSKDGWELCKKILQRAQRGTDINPIRDTLFTLTVVPQIISTVRGMQLHFGAEQELEADACAALWLQQAGVDPSQAWGSFREAFAQSGYAGEHPPTSERESNFVRKLKAQEPKPKPKPTPKGKSASEDGKPAKSARG